MKKERVDLLLVERGFFSSREQAKRAIMAGLVYLDEERVEKAGMQVSRDANLIVKGKLHPYVSRGGLKLEEAIKRFSLNLEGRIMLDIGASTGGFTDCALQHGAKKVYAIDVGYGQLAWKLRQDERVVVMERTNFRYITPEQIPDRANFAAIDVSFISLSLILPALKPLLTFDGEVVALVKPQFEAGKNQVGKKGVIKDPRVHKQVLHQFAQMAISTGFELLGLASSPIQGGEGNIEFLAYLKNHPQPKEPLHLSLWIEEVVLEAHNRFSK